MKQRLKPEPNVSDSVNSAFYFQNGDKLLSVGYEFVFQRIPMISSRLLDICSLKHEAEPVWHEATLKYDFLVVLMQG